MIIFGNTPDDYIRIVKKKVRKEWRLYSLVGALLFLALILS